MLKAEMRSIKQEYNAGGDMRNIRTTIHNRPGNNFSFDGSNKAPSSATGISYQPATIQRMQENRTQTTSKIENPVNGGGEVAIPVKVPDGANSASVTYQAHIVHDTFSATDNKSGQIVTTTGMPVQNGGTTVPGAVNSQTGALTVNVRSSDPENTLWSFQVNFTIPEPVNMEIGVKVYTDK